MESSDRDGSVRGHAPRSFLEGTWTYWNDRRADQGRTLEEHLRCFLESESSTVRLPRVVESDAILVPEDSAASTAAEGESLDRRVLGADRGEVHGGSEPPDDLFRAARDVESSAVVSAWDPTGNLRPITPAPAVGTGHGSAAPVRRVPVLAVSLSLALLLALGTIVVLLTTLAGLRAEVAATDWARHGLRTDFDAEIGVRRESASHFSPNGDHLVMVTDGGRGASIGHIEDGALRRFTRLVHHAGGVNDAAFNPDATRLVTATVSGSAEIWDVVTGERVLELIGHEDEIFTARFSADGTHVITASRDRTSRVWNVGTGEAVLVLRAFESEVRSATFSPVGRHLLTRTAAGTIDLWDARTGEHLASFDGPPAPLL